MEQLNPTDDLGTLNNKEIEIVNEIKVKTEELKKLRKEFYEVKMELQDLENDIDNLKMERHTIRSQIRLSTLL